MDQVFADATIIICDIAIFGKSGGVVIADEHHQHTSFDSVVSNSHILFVVDDNDTRDIVVVDPFLFSVSFPSLESYVAIISVGRERPYAPISSWWDNEDPH